MNKIDKVVNLKAKEVFEMLEDKIPMNYPTFIEGIRKGEIPGRKIGGRFYCDLNKIEELFGNV